MKSADLLLLDGRHLLWRCVNTYGDLGIEIGEDGWLDTGAMYGFLLLAKQAHSRYGGLVIVAWEAKTNFRLDLFPNYKGRSDQAKKYKEMKEALAKGEEPDIDARTQERFDLRLSLKEQQEHLQKILALMGIRQYMGTHCEADDIMGNLASQAAKKNRKVVIYTGDSDLYQIVSPLVTVAKPGRNGEDTLMGPSDVFDKVGVHPKQVADFKALAGDTADKIPGATGIGQKAASSLLGAYGDLEGVIAAAKAGEGEGWPCSEKQRKTVVAQTDVLRLYLQLTTINQKATLKPKIETCPDRQILMENLRTYQFSSFLRPSELRSFSAMAGIL